MMIVNLRDLGGIKTSCGKKVKNGLLFRSAELVDLEETTLFHCAAGKDRTGFGVALVLKILGVDEEYIFIDYLKTNEERIDENKKIENKYREKGLSENELKALKIAYSVEYDFLNCSFKEIKKQYGDFDNFLKEGLKIEEDFIENFREFFLEND